MNENAGSLLGDHPEIKKHLAGFISKKKITMIPYTAPMVRSADAAYLTPFHLEPGKFVLLIARPESENSILQIVRAYTAQKRGIPLVVLGKYDSKYYEYQKQVLDAGNDEVMFAGVIYDQAVVQALRFYARFYVHGYTVGGTNPSLVEALGAGSPVLAHDNRFNRWVAGEGALFFSDEQTCGRQITKLLLDDELVEKMRAASKMRYLEQFTEDKVYGAYERLLVQY